MKVTDSQRAIPCKSVDKKGNYIIRLYQKCNQLSIYKLTCISLENNSNSAHPVHFGPSSPVFRP